MGEVRDKIIQIWVDPDGHMCGLSDSGKVYNYNFDTEKYSEDEKGEVIHRVKVINKRWELDIDSPLVK